MNLSILIPTYTDHENVYRFLKYLQTEGIKLNNIFVVSDKIEDVDGENNIDKIIISLTYKVRLPSMEGVTCINKSFHGGRAGIVNYVHDLPITDDENIIVLEDDLFAEKGFFEQCDYFFQHLRTDQSPIFVGHSRIHGDVGEFFETYNLMHLWGFALKFGDLKKTIAYHDMVRKYTPSQKEKIIEDVLCFRYPCEVFEKYKSSLLDRIRKGFLANSKESADLYFMFYFLQNRLKIIKNTKSYIKSLRPEIQQDPLPCVELDIVSAINSFVD